jgi:hypothetical protein
MRYGEDAGDNKHDNGQNLAFPAISHSALLFILNGNVVPLPPQPVMLDH